jgi:hypothetical protein
MTGQFISIGIGSPAGIETFLLVGLSPNPNAFVSEGTIDIVVPLADRTVVVAADARTVTVAADDRDITVE